MYSKSEVQFEHPAKGKDHCRTCTHFQGNGKCEIVSGLVQPEDWCNKWKGSNVKKHWISKAINPAHKGDFAAKADKAGMSTAEYADQEKDAGGATGGQANLAQTLMRMNKKKKKG